MMSTFFVIMFSAAKDEEFAQNEVPEQHHTGYDNLDRGGSKTGEPDTDPHAQLGDTQTCQADGGKQQEVPGCLFMRAAPDPEDAKHVIGDQPGTEAKCRCHRVAQVPPADTAGEKEPVDQKGQAANHHILDEFLDQLHVT